MFGEINKGDWLIAIDHYGHTFRGRSIRNSVYPEADEMIIALANQDRAYIDGRDCRALYVNGRLVLANGQAAS